MQNRTYFSITMEGKISVIPNPVEFFHKTGSQLGCLVLFLGLVSQITHSSLWNRSLARVRDWNFSRVVPTCCHTQRKETKNCLLCSCLGTKAMGEELLYCFTFLVMGIPHWCYAESPSLPEGKYIPSWTEVLSKRSQVFFITNNGDT